MKTAISLNVSRDGLMRTMRDQFTSKTTFISELIQNGRRAGATQIDITFEAPNRFSISDDGSGIDHPGALLTIGQSNWDDPSMIEAENPFGIGFASAIFAAHQINIFTAEWSASFDTEALLNFSPIDVKRHRQAGTRFELTLKEEFEEQTLKGLIKEMVRGFSLPVTFNGETLPRPHALDASPEAFQPFKYGRCHLKESGTQRNMVVYLQGFRVAGGGRFIRALDDGTIVHLDPSAFRARVPDRDVLVDQKEAMTAIKEGVNDAFEAFFLARKAEMTPEAFAEKYTVWIESEGLVNRGLLDDVPLHRSLWQAYSNPPTLCEYRDDCTFDIHQPQLPETTKIIGAWQPVDESDAAVSTYLYMLGWPALSSQLNESHWARRHTIDPDALKIDVTPMGEQKKTHFFGNYIDCNIVICDGVTLAPQDKALPTMRCYEYAVFDMSSQTAYVPRTAISQSAMEVLVHQLSSYISENEDYMEEMADEDAYELLSLLRVHEGHDKSQIIEEMLRGKILSELARAMAGEAFTVSFDEKGQPSVSAAA